MKPRAWCLWCGENLPMTTRELGDFCDVRCSHEYHRDVGGYTWVLDLFDGMGRRGRELDSAPHTDRGTRKGDR